MSEKNTKAARVRKHAKAASDHHTTLSAFSLVVTLLEGGVVTDPAAYRAAERIKRICYDEQQRQLRKYDAAIAKVVRQSGDARAPSKGARGV